MNKKRLNYLQNEIILKKIVGEIKSINFNGLSTDTRTIRKNNLFLAIKGKKK